MKKPRIKKPKVKKPTVSAVPLRKRVAMGGDLTGLGLPARRKRKKETY